MDSKYINTTNDNGTGEKTGGERREFAAAGCGEHHPTGQIDVDIGVKSGLTQDRLSSTVQRKGIASPLGLLFPEFYPKSVRPECKKIIGEDKWKICKDRLL